MDPVLVIFAIGIIIAGVIAWRCWG